MTQGKLESRVTPTPAHCKDESRLMGVIRLSGQLAAVNVVMFMYTAVSGPAPGNLYL
jgi:hypothetical protein